MGEVVRQCRQFTQDVDIAVANLESVIVPHADNIPRKMVVSAAKCIDIGELPFEVLSLANNHILDCGESGLTFTESFLQRQGLKTVGAGRDIAAAETPLVLTINTRRIGIVSVTDATHYRATDRSAGVAPLASRRLIHLIRRLRSSVDLLVVTTHSDLEFTNLPAPWKVRLSRRLVEAGADVVVHHHPHTLQGIEHYCNGIIAYSLGNFVFPVDGNAYMNNREGHPTETVFLTIDVRWETGATRSIDYRITPAIIGKKNRLVVAEGEQKERIVRRMRMYSDWLQDKKRLRKEFFGACVRHGRQFLFGVYYEFRKDGFIAALKFVHLHLATGMHRSWMRGLVSFGTM